MDVNRIERLLSKERPALSQQERSEIAQRLMDLSDRGWGIRDVAELYGVSWQTVRRWIDRGKIAASREDYYWMIAPEDAMQAPGRFVKGWYRRKLSASDAVAVRRRVARGEVHRDVANDFGIHESLVTRIVNRERYANIEEE